MKTIRVTVHRGKAVVKTEGFTGQECYDVTANLEKALGKVEESEPTPEFRDVMGNTVNQR